MPVIHQEVFHLPTRYRLIINMMSMIGRLFGRDERLTAHITLLRSEINEIAEDEESYDALVDNIAFAMKVEWPDARAEREDPASGDAAEDEAPAR